MRTPIRNALVVAVVVVVGFAARSGSSAPAPTPTQSTPLPKLTCAKGVAKVQTCNAAGQCVTQAYPCFPYGCDAAGQTCHDMCKTVADCANGADCNTTTGVCAPYGSSCRDPFTIRNADGTTTSCVPYSCAGGACRSTCSTNADCFTGHHCGAEQRCVK